MPQAEKPEAACPDKIKIIKERTITMSAQGYDLQTSTSEEFAHHLRAETLKWEKIIENSGVTIE